MKRFERFWSQGRFARQAHRDLPEGSFEHELGRAGFAGPATHLYHPRPPTSWSSIEGSITPRAFDLNNVMPELNPLKTAEILRSDVLRVAYWRTQESMNCLVRNADGDDLLFVHEGAAQFFCDFGHLDVRAGNYLVIPRGTMWRVETDGWFAALRVCAIGSRFQAPNRGLLGRHALWDPGVLNYPKLNERFRAQADAPTTVYVQRRDELSAIQYPHNPLDALGWKGDNVLVRLDIEDLLPINSHRYHLPPSAHATFECDHALVSTFVPRPFETDATALKVPFFHSNDDVDEVIFYHAGDFFSRDNIDAGCMTFHPCGIAHGPHPKALTKMFKQEQSHTNEYAVMIDSLAQLETNDANIDPAIVIEGYERSWCSEE